jgi:hypothetical protein
MTLLLAAQHVPGPQEQLAVVATYLVAASGAGVADTAASSLSSRLFGAARYRLALANLMLTGGFGVIPAGIFAIADGHTTFGSTIMGAAAPFWFSYWRLNRATTVARNEASQNQKHELECRKMQLENSKVEEELDHKRRMNAFGGAANGT